MGKVEFGTTFSKAWGEYGKNFGPLAIAGLIIYLASFVLITVLRKFIPGAAGTWITNVINFLVAIPLYVGVCGMCLKILRGEGASGTAFDGFQKAGNAYVASFLPSFLFAILSALLLTSSVAAGAAAGGGGSAAVLGMLAGMLTGMLIMAAVALVLAPLFLLIYPAVADGMSGGEALVFAIQHGASNWGTFVLLLLASGAIGAVAAMVSCTLGLIVVLPWWMMIVTVAYASVKGEAAEPAAAALATPAAEAPAPEVPAPKPEDAEQPPAPEDEAPPAPPA